MLFHHPSELRSWNPNSGLDLQLLNSDHFKHGQKSLLCLSAFCSWIMSAMFKTVHTKVVWPMILSAKVQVLWFNVRL